MSKERNSTKAGVEKNEAKVEEPPKKETVG